MIQISRCNNAYANMDTVEDLNIFLYVILSPRMTNAYKIHSVTEVHEKIIKR